MNHNNSPEQNEKQLPSSLRNWIGIAVLILALVVPMVLISQRQVNTEETSLPDIVSAIEAGEVETLTVQGDTLVATLSDGTNLSALKEANISTVEILQALGVSPEKLRDLPIVVKNPNRGPGSLLGMLLTFAPILLIGFLMFRVMRNMQGGMMNMGGMGRSNPRVVSGAAEKEQKAELPVVTSRTWPGRNRPSWNFRKWLSSSKKRTSSSNWALAFPRGCLWSARPARVRR